ncbi:Threonine--tRNA ligase, cytoplasmic [Echinococcus granulosus]|uniref:threonine--tRNA ligase n=1 Tax=Echinococcus granulosus TaxID=6210 RepID=U6JJ13_ECHGR|nr:Threonyl-tRNA synthetase, cytoplasmic [Echinococcus granulosus]EUB58347.1 Threonyl-tRNA synthetase, cytoplasmic [Echinococcus granulosus]KAH9279316.1 Threonine--tRNA ligase, cytoplasmic [Echinococcus granulosus]CDS24048.1 Threonyl tRNA synthetase C [Echinococcus granulosus]
MSLALVSVLPAFRVVIQFYCRAMASGVCGLSQVISEVSSPPPPEFIAHRERLWQKLKKEYKQFVASQPRLPIEITLRDGSTIPGKAWETRPIDIARNLDKSTADKLVISKVNGKLWDLERPLEGNSTIEFLDFDDKDGQYVFWHSSAHIMGEAMERLYGGHLCYGPPIEEGFYYDMWMEGRQVHPDEYPQLNKLCNSIINEKQPFERLLLSKADLLKMFDYNEFKVRLLNERVTDPKTTVYKCGTLIDLCVGPHVRHTGCIKAITVTKSSSSYWEGRADAESLQRVYGISFPSQQAMKDWKHLQEEAASRDHRKLGIEQKLFFFNELSPGSCFFLPAGAHIYNKLVELMRNEYWKRGFQEVITPNIYDSKLWEISGHWKHYADNMFKIDIEKKIFGLKPMNCPGHCLMFAHELRSHRDLPLRMADFGVLHRNEFSGALTGLTRVRRFQQDDAHIFCREDQIETEIKNAIEFVQHTYGVFGFSFEFFLSTRPEDFMGAVELWDRAEKQLESSLNTSGVKWTLNEGDGAFYGPKIDIVLFDALRRRHQCGTIQLDFQLPERFDLTYQTGDAPSVDGECSTILKRPVIIHRAILGSVERFMAILTENFAGKWPFWLNPRQVLVVPVVSALDEYGHKVRNQLHEAGFMANIDTDPGRTLNKKVRNGQLAQYNFILVVGEKELNNGTVNVRSRENKVLGEHTVEHLIERFKEFCATKTVSAETEL